MKKTVTAESIQRLIAKNRVGALAVAFERGHPSVIAEGLAPEPVEEVARLLEKIDREKRIDIFSYLPDEVQVDLAARMPDRELVGLLEDLSHDERADLVEELPEDRRDAALAQLKPEERADIERLKGYPEGTVGAVMTSDFVSLPADSTARGALAHLRRTASGAETIYYSYVLDGDRRIQGVVTLKDLVLAPGDQPVAELMNPDVMTVRARQSAEEAVNLLQQLDLIALPVLDRNGLMVGIVTHDDLHDVAEEASTEDFHRLGGAAGLIHTPLRSASLPQLIAKRLPWLMVLVFMNIFSGAGIAYFEDTIAAAVSLVFFLPLLIDSGGNAGSQSATLMVRALATGDVRMRDWFRLLRREVGVALVLGLCMGAGVAFIGAFRAGPDIAVVVSLTMVTTVLAGSLIGMSLPFLLTRLKLDPATASAPLITSLADISGVMIYFSVARWLLGV